jgi:phosphoglycolate phosphatase
VSVAIPDGVEAVVFDLDGTLVRLAVDWTAVAQELRARFEQTGIDAEEWSVWDCYEQAEDHDLQTMVASVISEHELAGAESAERLPAADILETLECPVGVCSLNAEAACRRALERHELEIAVDVIVGRDTVDPVKPDPTPLLTAVEILNVAPSEALFVGNREKDAETARRAGVPFRYAGGDGPTE